VLLGVVLLPSCSTLPFQLLLLLLLLLHLLLLLIVSLPCLLLLLLLLLLLQSIRTKWRAYVVRRASIRLLVVSSCLHSYVEGRSTLKDGWI